MYIVKSTRESQRREFTGLIDAIDYAWRLAGDIPGTYRVIDDYQSSFLTVATIHADLYLRDISVAPEYMPHYIAARKVQRGLAR